MTTLPKPPVKPFAAGAMHPLRDARLQDLVHGLVPNQEFVFRDCSYQLRPNAPGLGQVPGGILQWTSLADGDQSGGWAFVVQDRFGTATNLLRLRVNWKTDGTQEFLLGEPLWGGRITFFGSDNPADPTIFIDDWQEALLLTRRTGWNAIACLSLENLPLVASAWAEDHPESELRICYNGTAEESENPQLRAAFKVFTHKPAPPPFVPAHVANRTGGPKPVLARVWQVKKSLIQDRAWLVPAGPNGTFSTIDAKLGAQGLLDHIANQRTANQPWPLRAQHPKLEIVPLPLPWPASVNGKALLKQLELVIKRYVALDDSACLVTALWVFMSYAAKAFRHLPVLAVTSPEFGCGKTTLLFLLQFLCRRALGLRGTGFARLCRGHQAQDKYNYDEESRETLLIDEAQTVFSNIQALERLETSFDSYELGVITLAQEELVRSRRRGASALAYREKPLPGRLASRCVHIDLQRQLPGEALHGREELLSEDVLGELTLLRSMIRRWAADNIDGLKHTPIPSLGWADPRADDVWRPLVKIAFAIDRNTGAALLATASDFVHETEDASAGKDLLSCIGHVIKELPSSAINSTELCNRLCENADWPWKTRGLNTTTLARLVRPYGIRPSKPGRIEGGGGKVLRSYRREDVEKALARYLNTQP